MNNHSIKSIYGNVICVNIVKDGKAFLKEYIINLCEDICVPVDYLNVTP